MIIKLLIMLGLIKLSENDVKPLTSTLIYVVVIGTLSILTTTILDWNSFLMKAGLAFILTFVYFWLLNKSRETFWWWLVMPIGLVAIILI